MQICPTTRLRFALAGFSALLGFLIAADAQVAAPLSTVKVTVVDQTGAVIPNSEVAFRSDSKTIVSHSVSDGSVTATLPSGRYAVSVSHLGFLKDEVLGFQVAAPEPSELRVALEVDSTPIVDCFGPCGDLIPTTTSEQPNVIEPRSTPVPPVQPVAERIRSWRCLHLWKCSTL